MSEFRKGRKRFISRDPSKANSQWKEGYNGSVIAKGTNVAATSKNDANYIHQPTFDLQATDLVTYSHQYTGSTNRIPSLKQRSTRPTSPNSGLRSEYYSSRPSDNRQNNDVSRSRDRSALRVITIDNKTRIGTERRMASEMGFRPILRRHGSSSSSSCESLSLKDNGIVAMASSKTTLCPVTLPDSHPAPTTTIPPITASQKTESGAQQGQTLPGTFLTLPANADSMQVQIRDTKISITRMSDQIQDATPRVRTLSAEYDNVPDPTSSPSAKDTSVPQSVPPAFAPSYESPGQLSPVRGLRLVPSPNSAFTKTSASKASSQIQSEYANWTVPALSLGPGRGPLELERSVKPSPRGQLNSIIPEQNPIDFNLIFSGIGLRPYDLEDFVPEKRKTVRALKSCSLESIPVVEGDTGKTPGRTNRASTNNPSEFDPQPLLGKTGTNKIDAPPNSKATGQSSVSISQTTSCDNQSNVKRLLTEVEIRPQRNYRVQSATITKPITDALAVIGKHPPTAQQPIRNSVVNDSSSLTLKALTDPFTNLSKTDLQPIADGPTNVFTSTVIQPITSSKQSYWATSVGSVTSASNVSHPVKSKNCLVEPCQSSAGPASRPITISTTSFGKVNVSTYILPPSSSSIMSTATPYSPPGTVESVTMAEPTMASAMSSLEKAISMLKSVAMDTSAPGAPMSILSTIATDTESLAKSFQLEARTVGTEFSYHQNKPLDGREVVLPPYELTIDGNQNTLKTGPTPEVAAPLPGDFEYSVREDAVLNLTLNLLDQTLAEIHQEFPPGRRPSAGKTPKAEVSSSATTLTSGPALHRLPEMTSYLKACHAPDQPKNSSTFPEAQHWNAPGSRVSAETTESDRCLRRILDRQDSFNRPGSSLFPETLPLPKDSVIQRYRRKKKTKSSASSSSSSSSSTSSSSREDGDGNGAAGAKRSPRSGRRHTRRHRRSEDGAAAAAGENKTKTRTCHRRRRAEEHSDKEQGRQTYKHADIQESKRLTYSLSNNLNLVASVESVTIEQSPVAETWQTLAAGPAQDHLQVFDSVYLSAKPSQETPDQSASINELSDLLLGSGVQQGVTPSTMYANSVSDSERTGISVVHRRFRNLGKSVEDDGDMASRLSPQGIPRPTSASSPRNQSTPIARSHSSGSCSPADTSTRTKNLTPFSHRRRRLGENRSPAANEEQVVNEHHQHQSHHMSFSSDRLSAASADEEVFLARVRQSVSPPQKLHDESSQSGIGPLRVRIRSKESISSGAHGCDHRTNSESPLSHREKVHSDSDRGPRESSLTGSVRLTLKQKSEDLTDESGPQKIRTLSTRTNSSTDEFPGIIRAHSKAISYESICLKIKEESTEIPKTIQVISMSQPSNLISTTKAVLLEQEETNCSPPGSIHGTPCSASQLYDVQSVEAISVRPVQRDHSIKHRSTVFFSSEQPPSGSHNNLLTQMKSASVFPVQTSKVSSFPAKINQQDVLESKRKSKHALPANISEQQNQSRSGEVVTQNKECRDDTLHTSTQKFAKSDAPQKLTIIGAPKHGAKPDKRLSKVGSTVQASNEIPNRSIVKESKFFLKRDQQLPMNNSQLIMGTVFTDRNNPRQNLLFPGTDFIQRDNSGSTSESKTSQGSKSVQQEAQIDAAGDIYVVDSGWNLSQIDGNPESPCPSSASEESNESMVIIDQPETTSESITKICRLQGPNNSQREFIRDLVQPDSEIEISAGRNLATTKDNRRGSDGVNESLTVSTRDTAFESVQSDGKRAERTDQTVKPEAEVVRGPLTKTPSIPSLEISVGKSEATSSSATTSTSSAKSTSSTKIATAAIASAKKSQNTDTVSKEGPLSHADKGGNLVQNFAVDILQKDFVEECRVGSGESILPETTKTNPSLVGLTKTIAGKEKTRRVVRFESQDEMLMYSPKEFSASGPGFSPPSDVPNEIPCLPINATEADALGASATISGPAVIRSPDAPLLGDFPSMSSRKDPETSREESSKASPPSTGKTMAKPCIVRKQLIHLDSALHPSSCVPPEAKPVEARWSPKLVRKLNLAEAKDVDVSDLDVAPDLMDFLSKQMEKASGDVKQPASNREAKDELEIGIREIPSLSVQRKPPLSLPLKSADREEDALPSATSATDNDAVKPEAEVGKRKFFSALKANASSFRAKKVPAVDDPSPDKSHLDRLASFALISDVGIGAKRRQFQQHKETSLTDPTTDAHSRLLTLESPPSTDRNQTKKASFLVLSSPDADDDNTKTRLGRDNESETRLGAESEKKTRLSRPEIDSDDDFDRLVEINFRQLVDEKGSAAEALRDVSGSMELLRKGAKNQTGTGLGGTSGTAGVEGSRRQMSRFKTQPVTPVEVEKAREMALYQSNSGN